MASSGSRSCRSKYSRKQPKVSGPEPLQESENCIICFEKVSCRGKLSVCDHWFCFPCILEWSKNTNTCPVCKKKFRCISKTHLACGKSPVQKVRVRDVDQRVWNDDEFPLQPVSPNNDDVAMVFGFYGDENESSFFETLMHIAEYESESDWLLSSDSDMPSESSSLTSSSMSSDAMTDDTFSDDNFYVNSFCEDSFSEESFTEHRDQKKKSDCERILNIDDKDDSLGINESQTSHSRLGNRGWFSDRSNTRSSRTIRDAKPKNTSTSRKRNAMQSQKTRQRNTATSTQRISGGGRNGPKKSPGGTGRTSVQHRTAGRSMTTRQEPTSNAAHGNTVGETSTVGRWLTATNGRPCSTTRKKTTAGQGTGQRTSTRHTRNKQSRSEEFTCTQTRSNSNTTMPSSSFHEPGHSYYSSRTPDKPTKSHTVLPKKRSRRTPMSTFSSDSDVSDEELIPSKSQKGKRKSHFHSPEQSGSGSQKRIKRTRRVLRERQNNINGDLSDFE